MQRSITISFTEEEVRFLLGALDKAPFQGLATARTVAVLAERLVTSLKGGSEPASRPSLQPAGIDGNGHHERA